jgi:hypothetical protein
MLSGKNIGSDFFAKNFAFFRGKKITAKNAKFFAKNTQSWNFGYAIWLPLYF